MKPVRDMTYRLEAGLIWLIYRFFLALPVDFASALGGWIGRTLGPRLPVSRRARKNLQRALPELDADRVVRAMWDNLGRCAAEFPHADAFTNDPARLQVVGGEYLADLRKNDCPALLYSGHLGNWELSYALGVRAGLRVNPVYRAPDNPYLLWLFGGRGHGSGIAMIPKGPEGARQTIGLLRKGELVAMFVDQKMNDGISVPFFGHAAMTAPALASLALKYHLPVLAFRIIRLGGAHFRAEIMPPVHFQESGNRPRDIEVAMTDVNHQLEQWIREYPGQWLWLHRRWPKWS